MSFIRNETGNGEPIRCGYGSGNAVFDWLPWSLTYPMGRDAWRWGAMPVGARTRHRLAGGDGGPDRYCVGVGRARPAVAATRAMATPAAQKRLSHGRGPRPGARWEVMAEAIVPAMKPVVMARL